MALLTADDVHWKQFQPTKFREGYDQEEVDEFLDEVVETIIALQDENESLKKQLDEVRQAAAAGQPLPAEASDEEKQKLRAELEGAQAQINQLQSQLQQAQVQANQAQIAAASSGDNSAAAEQIATLQAALAQSQAETQEARHLAEQAQNDAQQTRAALEQKLSETEAQVQAQAAPNNESQDATSMLSLAQRVHDEYVRNGQEEGERIIADCRAKGDQIIREANDERQQVLDRLNKEQSQLETRVDELKTFESDYRTKVSDHLRSLLDQVNKSNEE